jgi:pyruvate/2-oxoglutarate dehydrogenase complex dihydrolipoamide acyltransferase (E2) component
MKKPVTMHRIPPSRIATMDVVDAGTRRHHISALLEMDVTESRKNLRNIKRTGAEVSFTGWILKAIAEAIREHPEAAAYLFNKKRMGTFHHINISTMVEKDVEGKKVPIPLVIENTAEKSIAEITAEISKAKGQNLSSDEWVLGRSPGFYTKLYARLPGFVRRGIWNWIKRHPHLAYRQMGNVMVTSLIMLGRSHGWFIHKSVHPISFGIGAVSRKPWVIGNEVKIREILQMTVLLDHDVIDGAPMVRFINALVERIEKGADIR